MINMKVDQYALIKGHTRAQTFKKLIVSNQTLPQAYMDTTSRVLLRKNSSSGFMDKKKKKERTQSIDLDVEPLASPTSDGNNALPPSGDDPAMLVPSSEKKSKWKRSK